MTRWGMVIDLRKCMGCEACAVTCKETNQVPPGHWRQVVGGKVNHQSGQRMFLPMSCMHCSDPPCMEVCPTTATYRRPDGIVDVNYDLCIGCGYCVVACPFLARTISHNAFDFDPHVEGPIVPGKNGATANVDRVGVCTKCDFCLPRIEAGLAQGLQPGLHPEASPACTNACTAQALHFGDFDDPDSHVSKLVKENQTARLQETLGTDPAIYYIVA